MKTRFLSVLLTLALLFTSLFGMIPAASAGSQIIPFAEDCEHEYETTVVPPTCTEQGYTLHVCVKCGDSYESDLVYELLHDYPAEGVVTQEPTETERGVLSFTCVRCGAVKERPLAAGNEKAHKNEILFISDVHSGRNAENGYHNLRAMFRLLRENDDFVPEVVSGGGDYLESKTYDDADWPHCYEVLHDIMYNTSPDTVHTLTSGNHDWEWSRQSDEMIEKLLGSPRVGVGYVSDSFEIYHIGAHMNGTGQEKFLREDIAALREYLGTVAGSGKVIFVHTHWPLHYGYNNSYRTTTHADDMIELLNEFSDRLDIVFVWGHNHNQDTMRHVFKQRGDTLRIKKDEYMDIQFTYVNAGCLNERHALEGAGPEDSYYGPGYLLEARIEGDRLIFDYGHITGAYTDPDQAVYDHNADLLYVPEIQEERPSHFEVLLLHRSGCEHEYEDAVTPPTCTEGGYTTHTCTKCGQVLVDSELPPLGHDLSEHEEKEPTCTEPGWTAYQTCSRCDYSTFEELAALGHELTAHEGKEPSCTEPGWAAYQTCSRCDYTTYKALPALGHDFTAHEGKEPSCTEDGWAAYQTCTRCDYTTYEPLDALGHDLGAWTLTAPPSCTEQGTEARFCTRCDETQTRAIDTLGHDWAEPVYVWDEDDATVTASRACRRDAAHTQTETAAVAAEVTREATYEEDGELTCTVVFENPAFVPQSKTVAIPKLVKPNPLPCDGGETCPGSVFLDMPAKRHWAHDAIDWAVVNKITSGTAADTFSPEEGCTRAQVVTFLWRVAGEPVGTDTSGAVGIPPDDDPIVGSDPRTAPQNPFTDVSEKAFYYKAVLWAVEQGITKGMTETSFGPNDTCTRGQIVTFLWRFAGEPTADDDPSIGSDPRINPQNPFTDVSENAFYYQAVLWAVEQGITKGLTDTTFAPGSTCTRAQIVTFLYRYVMGQE